LAGQLAQVAARLPRDVELLYPDAPHACAAHSVERLAAIYKIAPPPPPHLCWWDASEDGAEYRGWENTRQTLQSLCEERTQRGRVGVLGFSQGAIVATALAALQQHGQFPRLDFVILIAGMVPRARVFARLLLQPLELPSLHIWGQRDAGAAHARPQLLAAFSERTRQLVDWPGPHAAPQTGPAADAIVDWVTRAAAD
jgi:predicted esterase